MPFTRLGRLIDSALQAVHCSCSAAGAGKAAPISMMARFVREEAAVARTNVTPQQLALSEHQQLDIIQVEELTGGKDGSVVRFSKVNTDVMELKEFEDGPSCPILNFPRVKKVPEPKDVIHCFEDGMCLNKSFKPKEDPKTSDVIFCFTDGKCHDEDGKIFFKL